MIVRCGYYTFQDMNNIRIILLHTSHSGNIGAAARAMKVMGLNQLIVVNPQCDPFDGKARALSAHADDVWRQLEVVDHFDQALTGCELVLGATARNRSLGCEQLLARQAAEYIVNESNKTTAIVFGSEKDGLSNSELDRCHYQIRIPTADEYSSLNLAQAVQIMVYEWQIAQRHHVAALSPPSSLLPSEGLATADQLDGLYRHLEAIMKQTGFYKATHPRRMETRLRQAFNRARLDSQDINLLRGIFSSIDRIVETDENPKHTDFTIKNKG